MNTDRPSAVSRRTLAKGAAWSVPVLSVAAAAPALAASAPEPPVIVAGASYAEKCQGEATVPNGWPKQGYRIEITVSPADAPAPVLTEVTLGNGSTGTVLASAYPLREGVWEYVIDAESSPSSITLSYTIGDGPVQTVTIPASPHCSR